MLVGQIHQYGHHQIDKDYAEDDDAYIYIPFFSINLYVRQFVPSQKYSPLFIVSLAALALLR